MLGECIGTFFLVLVACMIIGLKSELAPLVIGLTLMVMVFTGGHISGGHFNPAVSLGVWSCQGIPGLRMLYYFGVQLVAGIAAAGMTGWLLPDEAVVRPLIFSDWPRVLLAEVLGTFALVYAVLNVTVSKDTVNNGYYGLAIGITVTVMAYALGGISGGIFNPALAVSMNVMGYIPKAHILTYLSGEIAGAALASFIFKLVDTNRE
jgi:aquaporin Z